MEKCSTKCQSAVLRLANRFKWSRNDKLHAKKTKQDEVAAFPLIQLFTHPQSLTQLRILVRAAVNLQSILKSI